MTGRGPSASGIGAEDVKEEDGGLPQPCEALPPPQTLFLPLLRQPHSWHFQFVPREGTAPRSDGTDSNGGGARCRKEVVEDDDKEAAVLPVSAAIYGEAVAPASVTWRSDESIVCMGCTLSACIHFGDFTLLIVAVSAVGAVAGVEGDEGGTGPNATKRVGWSGFLFTESTFV